MNAIINSNIQHEMARKAAIILLDKAAGFWQAGAGMIQMPDGSTLVNPSDEMLDNISKSTKAVSGGEYKVIDTVTYSLFEIISSNVIAISQAKFRALMNSMKELEEDCKKRNRLSRAKRWNELQSKLWYAVNGNI